VVASAGTVATMLVAVGIPTMEAILPLNRTILFAAVVLNSVPWIVTEVPAVPLRGKKLEMASIDITVKSETLVAKCPSASTVILPDVAPAGTVVKMLVPVAPSMIAIFPLNFTMLLKALVLKFVPWIVTEVPAGPLIGLKLEIEGNDTEKSEMLVARCPSTSTVILPVVAPAGTFVTMLVVVGDPFKVAFTPLNLTMILAPMVLKFVPTMVTEVPAGPLAGLKLEIEGNDTEKSEMLVATCPSASTVILPVVAPGGTRTKILFGVGVPLIVATTPLNLTMFPAATVLKFKPRIVTKVPAGPLVGLMIEIEGIGTEKSEVLVANFPFASTVIFPDVVSGGTFVRILVPVDSIMIAVFPLNLTMLLAAMVLKFVPRMVTEVPILPLDGLKLVIVGLGGANVSKTISFPYAVPALLMA